MKERFFVSTGVFGQRALPEILKECKALGIHGVELSSGAAGERNLAELLDEEKRQGTNFLIHNYFPPPKRHFVLNLASRDEENLGLSREHCRSAIGLCSRLGIPFYSVHSGFAFEARPEHLGKPLTEVEAFSLEQAEETFVESLKILCDFGAKVNVRLLIENNVVTRANLVDGQNRLLLGATAEDLGRICENVRRGNLGLLLDVGHLKVTARTLKFEVGDFFERLRNLIEAFHVSENDGTVDNNQPFDKTAWFIPYVRAFPSAVIVLEAYRLGRETLRKCMATMKQEF